MKNLKSDARTEANKNLYVRLRKFKQDRNNLKTLYSECVNFKNQMFNASLRKFKERH